MILKGNQRGRGQQLATQLLNADNNQRVEILGLRGSIARDLRGAFEEWSACAIGTQCRKYLYSLSVNPDPLQAGLTRAQYFDLIGRAEKELRLSGQPRAVVFHVHNDGREHYHVVQQWRHLYNHIRPHTSLGYRPSAQENSNLRRSAAWLCRAPVKTRRSSPRRKRIPRHSASARPRTSRPKATTASDSIPIA